jgi:hypothetical protein
MLLQVETRNMEPELVGLSEFGLNEFLVRFAV